MGGTFLPGGCSRDDNQHDIQCKKTTIPTQQCRRAKAAAQLKGMRLMSLRKGGEDRIGAQESSDIM